MIGDRAQKGYTGAMAEPIVNKRLYERVARDIAAKIAEGSFAIGQRLPAERHLAATYSVSRPTVREALIALELDGLVDVRKGSGVYVVSHTPKGGQAGRTDIGPFELIEARRAFEGEVCALAATLATEDDLAVLAALIVEIDENAGDVALSEEADRRFHLALAKATQNSAMVAVVDMLWEARERSPQYRLLTEKARAAGVTPRSDEHAMILNAVKSREAEVARRAMHTHLSRVLSWLLEATEVHEVEQVRARAHAQRRRYAVHA